MKVRFTYIYALHDKKMRGYTIYDIYYDDYHDVRIFFAFEERFLRHSLRTGNCARTPDWSLSSSTVYNVVGVVWVADYHCIA